MQAGDWKAAVRMFIASGEFRRAAQLAIANEWTEGVVEIARTVGKGETETLQACGKYLVKIRSYQFAEEVGGAGAASWPR